jgi:hypothetical protein
MRAASGKLFFNQFLMTWDQMVSLGKSAMIASERQAWIMGDSILSKLTSKEWNATCSWARSILSTAFGRSFMSRMTAPSVESVLRNVAP